MDKKELSRVHHQEHRQWLSQLNFYEDEIKIFQKELSMIVERNPSQYSISEHAEEYNKIFRKKLKKIFQLKEQLNLHEKGLSSGKISINDELWDHEETRLNISKFIRKIEDLKKNFKRFVSRQM